MTDDQLLLANAYVDGELDAPERARAEGDPDVMAEVARLRPVVDAVRDVAPPAAGQRERAIAAALAARDAPDGADGPAEQPVAPPTPLRPRRAWWAGAGVAAAAVLVVAGGIAVLGGGDGSNDGSGDAASFATAAAARDALLSESSELAAAGAPAAPQQDQDAADTARSAATAGGATSGVVLRSPDELAAWATEPAREIPPAAPGCPAIGTYVGDVWYGDAAETDETDAVEVEVFVTTDEAVALDAGSCVEVARAALP